MIRKISDLGRAFRQEFPLPMEKLFKELIWPAAAGNVAWALAQLVVNPPAQNCYAYGALLLLIAAYLVIDWLRSDSASDKTWKYWPGDFVLITGIVGLAIAVQSNKSPAFLHGTLSAVFGAAVLLHLTGAWEKSGQSNWRSRFCMAGCGFLGLAILGASYLAHQRLLPLTLPISFGTVLIAWLAARTIMNERNAST